MNVAELFAEIGLKGADKSVADVLAVKEGMQGAAAATKDLKGLLSDFGVKGADKTVAGLLGLQKELEDTALAGLQTKTVLEGLDEVAPDDVVMFLADMREQLGEIAKSSEKAAESLTRIKPKNPEKTKDWFDSTRKGLKDMTSLSLEAKAAIIAVGYAMERAFMASGKRGTDLANAAAALGVNPKTLQQYQYVAKTEGGVSKEETTGAFESLSQLATQILTGQARPIGISQIGAVLGRRGIKFGELIAQAQIQNRPELLIQALQAYAQNETNLGLRNQNLASFGMSPAMIALLSKGAFSAQALGRAPTLSEGQVQGLDAARKAGAQLENSVEMAVDKFTAAHGAQIIKEITPLVGKVLELANAFTKLAENIKIFEALGKVFAGWAHIFSGAASAVKAISEAGTEKGRKNLLENVKEAVTEIPGVLSALWEAATEGGEPTPGAAKGSAPGAGRTGAAAGGGQVGGAAAGSMSVLGAINPAMLAQMSAAYDRQARRAAAPPMPAGIGAPSAPPAQATITQTLQFSHPGTDPKATGDSVKKAVGDAYRSISAQIQGS